MDRGLIAEIDLDAIAHNLRIAKKIAKNRTVIAVVKADAYGHGAIEVSMRLVREGAACLAVAYTSEAVALRKAGIKVPIIVLFDKYNIQDYFKYNLIPVIYDIKTAQKFSKGAQKNKQGINVHIKIDTGMGRLGFDIEYIEKKIDEILKMDSIRVTGLMSHFSDADLSDRSYALLQLGRFNSVRNALIKRGIKRLMCHIANSAATMSFDESHLDAVRPGLMLYGYSPITSNKLQVTSEKLKGENNSLLVTRHPLLLKPAMTVKTKILSMRKFRKGTPVSYGRTFITTRESLIAVLPAGYADGYTRIFSNNSDVLIRGKCAPVVGRICMDTTMVDVTDVRDVVEGDEVILLGKQNDTAITASELGVKAGTIPYEILTSLGNKARKVYLGSN